MFNEMEKMEKELDKMTATFKELKDAIAKLKKQGYEDLYYAIDYISNDTDFEPVWAVFEDKEHAYAWPNDCLMFDQLSPYKVDIKKTHCKMPAKLRANGRDMAKFRYTYYDLNMKQTVENQFCIGRI